jgi:hypothetical protein
MFLMRQSRLAFYATSLPARAGLRSMTRKSLAKPKLTDADRHNRFVAMAQQVGASDDVKDFEKAFQKAFKSAFEKMACRKDATRRRTS